MRERSRLPFTITLCALLVLSCTVWNLVRMVTSIAWSSVLQAYTPRPGALYIGLTGATWFVAGIFILEAIWRRRRWALVSMLLGAWLYAAWAWSDRLLLQSGGSANWRFSLLITALLLAIMTAVALDRRSRVVFRKEAHESEPENPSSA